MADQHTYDLKFIPNPLQKRFIESRAPADLFSSRMGEGKSAALAWSIYYHTKHNPGAIWAMIRDTWENLQATSMQEFFKWFPPGICGTYIASKKEYQWAEGFASGKVQFLGMDAAEDASKLMSRPLAGMAIDEPAPAVGSVGIDEMIFTIGMTRLRQEGMNWYSCKLAENNPDETHWTYKRFVDPGTEGYEVWQPDRPENMGHLPPGYYESLRQSLSTRPDLVRRFVDGDFGFQRVGKSVTPQWSDRQHLALGLYPMKGVPLALLWDFGLNPTCIITQVTPLGHWNILDAMVGDGIGADELIHDVVKPLLTERYPQWARRGGPGIRHIGDPAGLNREQSSSRNSAVRVVVGTLGGTFQKGPKGINERVLPLQTVLARSSMSDGKAVVQVDRHRAAPVWHALRGGWHYHVARTGIVGGEPAKDMHSHPGDAMGYGAAVLYPVSKLVPKDGRLAREPKSAGYFGRGEPSLGFERPGLIMPTHGSGLKLPDW